MCLITACPEGTDKSSKALEGFIKSGMYTNDDGSGFMYKRKGSDIVGVMKGFRKPEAIMESIDSLKLKAEDELVIHHRIGTSGLKNDQNMHPFYLSNEPDILNTTKGNYEIPAMAHNGNFFRYASSTSTHSDTWHFVEDLMSTPELISLIQNDPKKFETFFKEVLGTNKLAFLFPNRSMILIGRWEDEDGYFHSNMGYKRKIIDVGGVQQRTCSVNSRNVMRSRHDNEHELSSMFEQQKRFLTENHVWDEKKKIWVPKQKEIRLANPIESGGNTIMENIAQNLKKIQDRIKTSGIRFTDRDIEITEKNFQHFIIVPHTNYVDEKSSVVIPKNRAYTLENYDKNALVNYIVSFDSSKVMEYVDIPKFLKHCHIFVKKENVNEYYKSLNKISLSCSVVTKEGFLVTQPSATMLKKISKKLGSNGHKDEIQYKDYGLFKLSHLRYFYNQHNAAAEAAKKLKEEAKNDVNSLGTPDVKNIVGNEDNAIVPEDFAV